MSTNWKRLYGPLAATDTSDHAIVTAATQTAIVLTKVTVSNITSTAALGTLSLNIGAGAVIVWQRVVPGQNVQGGVLEVAELEGHTLNPGDILSFKAGTANALAPTASGVEYTP